MVKLRYMLKSMILATVVLIGLAYFFPCRSQVTMTIDRAKERLKELQFNYSTADEVVRQKIEREIASQVDTKPKGEFETTKEFKARNAKADSIRRILERKYESDKIARKLHFRREINELQALEFYVPAQIQLGVFDADTEKFPTTVLIDGKEYQESIVVPRNEAKILKENITKAETQGILGVGISGGKAVDYFFGIKVGFDGKVYTSVPPVFIPKQADMALYPQIYKNPFVLHLRRVLNAFVKGTANASGFETTLSTFGTSLSTVDQDYFQSKFMVASISQSAMGGKDIDIVFLDRPDTVFHAWVYKLAEGGFELRLFAAQETDLAKVRKMRIIFKQFLNDRVNSL